VKAHGQSSWRPVNKASHTKTAKFTVFFLKEKGAPVLAFWLVSFVDYDLAY